MFTFSSINHIIYMIEQKLKFKDGREGDKADDLEPGDQ